MSGSHPSEHQFIQHIRSDTIHILVATKHVHVYVICVVGWLISHNTEAALDKGL